MMRERVPLPGDLPPAFTVREARDAGVRPARLYGRDLERPFYGVRTTRRTDAAAQSDFIDEQRESIVHLARAYAARMDAAEFFSHTTAAALWGIPLPSIDDLPLHVSVLRPLRAHRTAGIRGHQIDPRLVRVTVRDGLRLTSPASTWALLGSVLDPYDLVAAGDAVVFVDRAVGYRRESALRPPLATIDELKRALDAGRRPGLRALRDAIVRVRVDSRSRPETWARLILVDAGLPEPLRNYDVYDDDGQFLGSLDLAYPDHKVGIEYESTYHRTSARQFAKDIDRIARFESKRWRIIRVTGWHVFTAPTELVRRVAGGLGIDPRY